MAAAKSEKAIDRQISVLEAKLNDLRKRKLVFLQQRLQEAQRQFDQYSGGKGSASYPHRIGNPKGGPRGPRLSDEEVLARLTKEVKAAGDAGISAREACKRTGVFYLRGIKVMDQNFKKSGTGKWTRYRLK